MQEVEFNRGFPAKEGDQHPHFALVFIDIADRADEVHERPFDNPHRIAPLQSDFDPGRAAGGDIPHKFHFCGVQRHRLGAAVAVILAGDETGYARRLPHYIPAFIVHHHLDQHIAGEAFPHFLLPLPVLEHGFPLDRYFHRQDAVLHLHTFDAGVEVALDPFLLTGIGMDDVPEGVIPLDGGEFGYFRFRGHQ